MLSKAGPQGLHSRGASEPESLVCLRSTQPGMFEKHTARHIKESTEPRVLKKSQEAFELSKGNGERQKEKLA